MKVNNFLEKIENKIKKGKFKDNWESLEYYRIPQWYKDSKFGIFIHWGIYSVPAFRNEWYPHLMYKKDDECFKYHIEEFGDHKEFGYKDFIPLFKAEKFNPEEWAELFEKSGAKFIVPVAEHHDGFCMYKSKLTKWNSVNMGPKRDIIGELKKEVVKRGLKFGVSSHRAEHWWFFFYGNEIDSDVKSKKWDDFYGPAQSPDEPPNKEFLTDWLLRCCELVDKYKPDIFWFDWWIQHYSFEPYLKKFAAYYYNRGIEWKKEVVINYKFNAFPEGTAVYDIERGVVKDKYPIPWQIDTSISKNSWGYITNHDYKNVKDIIHDIIDTVSKNGVYLLNIGPKPDGLIPEYERDVLIKIGDWLKVNGEAIYGTRPYRFFGEGETEVHEGYYSDTKRKEFSYKDIRFTRKENIVYAIFLGKPDSSILEIKKFSKKENSTHKNIKKIEIIENKKPVKWEINENEMKIYLPDIDLNEYAFVLKIYLDF